MREEELHSVIEEAQAGKGKAKNRLIEAMLDNGCMRRLNRYLYLNRLLSPDDVKAEFWLGVVKAIPRVRYDIGDPLQFLAFKGIKQVQTTLKIRIRKGVVVACKECGKRNQLKSKDIRCPSCGTDKVETYEREVSTDIDTTYLDIPSYHIREEIELRDRIAVLKEKLSKRELEVFKLIVEGGYDSKACKNYLKEIGSEMGISAQCVSQYLKRIRRKLEEIK